MLFAIGMPILIGTTIHEIFRNMQLLSNTKLLFVSTAGNSGWITSILNGNTNGKMNYLQMYKKAV